MRNDRSPAGRSERPGRARLYRRAAMVIAAAAVVATAAVVGSSSRAANSVASGTLTIATAEPPQTFDPIQAGNSTVDQMVLNNYDALVRFTSTANTKLVPALATTWNVSKNGLVYTFTLRPGVTFHDGTRLTATDVKFTLDRYLKLKTGWYSELQALASSKVVSPSKIAIRLSHKYAPFVSALSRVYILNSKLVGQHLGSDDGQTWLANNDAGSGPYVLDKYTPNQTAQFSSYPKYWRGWSGSHADKVVYNFVPEAATQKAALESGQADIAMNIAKSDLPGLKKNSKYKVIASNTLVQYYIFFNTAAGPTKNKLVREALATAYDYKTHVNQILDGYGQLAKGPLPRSIPCWDSAVTQPTFSLSKAKSLLQKAGYTKLTLSMEYLPVLEEEMKSFELFQSDLSKIGVTLKPIATTFPAYFDMVKKVSTTPDLAAVYAFPPFPDANEVMYINFDSSFRLARGYNWGQYSNPKVDALVRKAQTLSSDAARCPLYKQAQKLVANDYVEINGSLPQYTTVISSKVKGYAYNPAHHQTENTYDISVSG